MVTRELVIATCQYGEALGGIALQIDNKKIYRLFFAVFIFMSAHATERPLILKQFMDNNETASHVTVVKNLSAEEKAFFWKNTRFDANGVILKTNPLDMQLTSIERMFANSNKTIKKSSKIFKHISKTFDSKNIISELQESENWTNYFIKVPTGIAMLTIRDLAAGDMKTTIVADFLNAKVRDAAATLVLINGEEKSNKRRWVLYWFTKNIDFELQVPDEIQADGSTKLTKKDIIDFAMKMINP